MTKQLQFTEQEILKWSVGSLAASCLALLAFIRKHAVGLIKKRNDNIEKRLKSLESGQAKLFEKVREVNHKIDNQDKAEASAFQLILDKLDVLEDKKRNK